VVLAPLKAWPSRGRFSTARTGSVAILNSARDLQWPPDAQFPASFKRFPIAASSANRVVIFEPADACHAEANNRSWKLRIIDADPTAQPPMVPSFTSATFFSEFVSGASVVTLRS